MKPQYMMISGLFNSYIKNTIFRLSSISVNEKVYSKCYSQSLNKVNYPISTFNHECKTKTSVLRGLQLSQKHFQIQNRYIWGWLNSIFNRVDESRILDAGPDRACAEWLLRCGAGVKWVKSDKWLKDYNSLPLSGVKLHKIEEVDGTDSAIMYIGFPYFRNCKNIRKVVFHRATYIDDDALSQLHYLKKSLKELQISSCGNVSRRGLDYLKILGKLERLLLYDLPRITDKEEVIQDLKTALPNCEISFPYAQSSEIEDKDKNS